MFPIDRQRGSRSTHSMRMHHAAYPTERSSQGDLVSFQSLSLIGPRSECSSSTGITRPRCRILILPKLARRNAIERIVPISARHPLERLASRLRTTSDGHNDLCGPRLCIMLCSLFSMRSSIWKRFTAVSPIIRVFHVQKAAGFRLLWFWFRLPRGRRVGSQYAVPHCGREQASSRNSFTTSTGVGRNLVYRVR